MNETETQFEKVEVNVGTVSGSADYRRVVRFQGLEIAFVRTYDGARSKDDRGQDLTLYECTPAREDPKKKYRIHIKSWSNWQGETDHCFLAVVDSSNEEVSRQTGGDLFTADEVSEQFPSLANEAGISVPIELD